MLDTRPLLSHTDFPSPGRTVLDTLQINLGYRCNLSCSHCHVNAGPQRREEMDSETVDLVLAVLEARGLSVLDLTGGAPELNPHFRRLVIAARQLGVEVIDRCNLVILNEPGQEDLAAFLAEQQVTVTASLPCYSADNVSRQRGKGIFEQSIVALQKLNALGYGRDPALPLNLVYNPVGPSLPPPQKALQADYQRELKEHYGIDFNHLFTLTNMPISRFGAVLLAQGQYEDYMALLRNNYRESNLSTVMCRSLVSVDYQGYLYDCDFNQMLNMPLIASDRMRPHLRELLEQPLDRGPIAVGEHCYGCTAGQGSSCGGALDG